MAVVLVFFDALSNRDHASMSGRTKCVLKLDCRVVDAEVPQQAFLDVAQDALAH